MRTPDRACSATLPARPATLRGLRRAGFRQDAAGVWVRRLGRGTLTVCTRTTATPRWLTRPLGRAVKERPGRRFRDAKGLHSVSSLHFPQRLTDRFSIDLPDGLGTSGWQMRDVPPAPIIRHHGGARYATADYDVLYEAGYGRVKESIVVHRRQGARTWSWKLHWTKGSRPRLDDAGRVVFGGKVVLDRPVVFAANGRTVMRPRWTVTRNVVSFTVNDRRLALPYVVDPTADFPQRIHPDKVAGTRINGAEDIRATSTTPASSCTKLPLDGTGEALFGSMIARRQSPGGAIATATPSGGPNGWALQDGTSFPSGKQIFGMDSPTDSIVVAVGEDGLSIRSTDGGCTWTRLATNTTNHLRSVSSPSAGVIWIVGDAGTALRSTDGGATFANVNTTGSSVDLRAIDSIDANNAWVGGKNRLVARTTNGGSTWTSTGVANMGDVFGVTMVTPDIAWVVTDPGKIFKTTNGGGNWSYQANTGTNLFDIDSANSNLAWAVGDSGIVYRTTDGANWSFQFSSVAARLTWVDVVSASVIWAGGEGGTIVLSTDGGASWTSLPNAAGTQKIHDGAARSATLAWAGDEQGRVQRYYPSGGPGSWGWVSQANGGTTLSAGPWTVGARLCRETWSTGIVDVGFRARIWKVAVNGAGITASTPMTPWSAASPSVALAGGACTSATVPLTPTVLSMLPTEHFYIEYGLRVYGNARANETVSLSVADPDTYVDFSAPAANSTPVPTNLRVASTIGPNGWTNDTTPTLRANLVDPDWWHHNRYQICADAACSTVVAEGTSAAGQLLGSTNNAWTTPTLPDGFYFIRTRTEEDGGETAMSAWTPIDPDTALNRCAATDVGPCDKFGIDTALPTAPAGVNDGTGTDIDWTGNTTSLSANWGASTDAGGINRYEYCMSTTLSGSNCSGTIVQAWTSAGAVLGVTRTGLSLSSGTRYYTCVRAVDNAGNTGPATCSDGVVVDTTAPPASAEVRDGTAADLDFTPSATQLDANWTAVADIAPGSGLERYDACFSTSSTGADCGGAAMSPWTSTGLTTAASRTVTALADGTTYFACVRAVDNVGNIGATRCSDGITVDLGAPTAAWSSWSENSAYLYSPGGSSADLLWYNPAAPLETGIVATATVTATDARSGMDRVDYPNLAAGAAWGPGGTDSTVGAGDTWTHGYTFTGGGVIGDPAPNNATAYDKVGRSTGAPALSFRIEPDGTGPASPAMAPMSGLQNTVTYAQSIALGTDSQSGIARWVMDVQFAPMYDGVCGAWDPWIDGSTLSGYSGTATNGSTLSFVHRLNDPNFDGVPDYKDAFCFRDRVRVYDNVQNLTTISENGFARFDFGEPDVGITGPPDGSSQSGTFPITGSTDDVWPGSGFEYVNTGSGIQEVVVTYALDDGPDADLLPDATGSVCPPVTTFGGPWTAHTWSCSWATGPLDDNLADGWYTVSAQARDRAGNLSTIATRRYLLDNKPPVAAWHSWEDGGDPTMHAVGSVAWVNPNAPVGTYKLDARVTATDLGSGVDRIEFPGLGTGWTPGSGITNATFTDPVPAANAWTMSYTYTDPALLAAPGVQAATAFDGAGNDAPIGFEVRLDGAAPTGVGASVANTNQPTAIVNVTLAGGSEGTLESGLGSWVLLVDMAPLANDTCGAFANTYAVVATGVGIAPSTYAHDVTATGSACYRYRLDVTDNVGNVGTSGVPTTAQRVDLVDPTVDITSPADGSVQGGTFNIAGDAVDVHTGIDRVRLTWTGPSSTSGTICDPATLGGTPPNWTFTCSWATGPLDLNLSDGTYTVTATSYDRAGRVSAVDQISVILDNNPPFIGFHSFDTSATTYAYWAGPVGTNNRLWYNPNAPAGSHSFDVLVTASDPNGVPRVEYDGAGAGWTPGAAVATQTVAIGPADRWSQTYTFDTSAAVADPPTLRATAYDPAGNPGWTTFELTPDMDAPALGTLSYPNGFHGTTSVDVNVATGTDGTGSGIRSWQLLRSDGTLSGTTCGSWGAYSLSVGTGLGEFTGTVSDTVGDPGCFRYRLVVTDNVGRVGTFDGTDVTMIDLTPPTGSITLAEGTNPEYQFLASSTRIFVNTNAPASGTFTATVNATAASGILDVKFPVLATGFTGDGVMPGPGPTFVNTYGWTGPAGSPPAGLQADVRSNSLGPLALPFEVIADADAPTAASPTHASGFTTSTSVSVSWTTGSDGSGSGVLSHQLERETGTLAAGACTWSGTWTAIGPINGPATQTDSTLAHATCYRYRTTMTDNVGNVGSSLPSSPIMVDTTAPTGATITLTEGTNPARQWVSAPDTIWVAADPGGAADFAASVTATDPESGTGSAVFPALGSTFVYTSTGAYTASYAWSATATTPAVAPVVQVSNGSGLTTTIPFTVNVDGDAPTGATLDQEAGIVTDFMVDLSYTTGNDGTGSGIATWQIERRSAPYDVTTDTCGTWIAWAVYPSAPGQPTSPHVDSSVDQPNCYQYQLVEIDNVGNVTPTVDGDTVKVIFDVTPPEPFSLTLPTNPALPAITTGAAAPSCASVPTYPTATPTLSWTASSDTQSGLSHYDVYVDDTTAVDASVPAPGTSWTSPALAEGAHTLGVRALDFRLNFRNADPAFPTDFRVDTTAPTGSLAAPADGSWTGDTTPTLDWNATDTNCLARIEVYLDGSATPVAVASGTEGAWTPTTALSDGMHTWSFKAIDTVGNTATFGPFTFGVDTTAPAPFTVTAPTAGQTVRGFVDVAWTASSDADSGLATASTYEVWVDGAVRATVGPATTATRVGSITSGGHSVFVRAYDAVGNYIDTAPVLFTGYGVIPKPVLISPADLAYINAVPTLDWDWPSDGGPSPTSYDVMLDGALVGSQLHPTTQHLIADPGDGSHSWQIVQHDPYTGTVSSNTWSFVLDRTVPNNPGPLSRSATTVSWPAPTDPAAPIASGIAYQEFWIENSAGTRTSTTLLAAATSRNYGTLPDDTYTMWVRAYDRAGNFTDSPTLVVVNDSVPPTAFNLTPPPALGPLPAITHGPGTAPSCETDPTYVGAMPTLEWAPSSDATSGLAGYDVYVDGAMVATVGPAVTSYTVATPLAGGAHSWRVVARDNFGLTRASTPSPMNVRVDALPPSITYDMPADGAYTSDTTPSFSWALTDDNCAARVELTVGTNVYVLSATETAFAPSVVLPEGPTTWSVRVFDSAGNVVSAGPARTINVDTTAPTGVTAIFPLDGGTPDEQMMTFEWSAGTDGGSGVQRYDLIIDGTQVAAGLTTLTRGTFPIYAGPHTWAIRAYDAVGNSRLFSFSFDAQVVPDTTAPSAFNLLSPADAAAIPSGTALEWEPAWDFKGVTQYRVYIDGNLAGTTAGNVTSFTPSTGAGAPICTVTYDPALNAGCITGPTYSWGNGSLTNGTGATSPDLGVASYAGWSASGAAIGVGDPTVTPITNAAAGYDGDRVWTAVEYGATIPAAGADIRFEHRYLTHTIGESAYDGATVELKVDDEGDGFGNDLWESTCEVDAKAVYGTTLDCVHEVVALNGGYTAVMGGADKDSHPLSGQHSFAGDSGGTVQTSLSMAKFAGMNVRFRFRLGMDSCYVGMPADWAAYCDDPDLGAPGYHPAQWRIDDVTLADPALLPGLHTWYVVARDAAGNSRTSTQTWTFDLQ